MIKIIKSPASNYPKNSKFIYIFDESDSHNHQNIYYNTTTRLRLVELQDGRINRD